MAKRSAGVLLFDVQHRQPRVLLVHPGGPFWARKDDGVWSLPKGEHAEDELPQRAALREFHEETGLRLPEADLLDLGRIRQKGGKEVAAWAAEGQFDVSLLSSNHFEMPWPPRSGETRSFPEVDRAEWCDPDTARHKLILAQVAFLERLLELLQDADRVDPSADED